MSDPAAHGGQAVDSFDVVVPSIPGFGFSGEPAEDTDMARTAELWVALMEKLGYRRFGAYGSDFGARITRTLGARFPDRLVGIHTPGTPPLAQRDPETDEEREYVARAERWSIEETGYQRIQGTKPQTLAYGLTDSPVGLAAWIVEKLRAWSDCGGDVESRFSKDQILTLVSILLAHAHHRDEHALLPREHFGEPTPEDGTRANPRAPRLRGIPWDIPPLAPAALVLRRASGEHQTLVSLRLGWSFSGNRGARAAGSGSEDVLPAASIGVVRRDTDAPCHCHTP